MGLSRPVKSLATNPGHKRLEFGDSVLAAAG